MVGYGYQEDHVLCFKTYNNCSKLSHIAIIRFDSFEESCQNNFIYRYSNNFSPLFTGLDGKRSQWLKFVLESIRAVAYFNFAIRFIPGESLGQWGASLRCIPDLVTITWTLFSQITSHLSLSIYIYISLALSLSVYISTIVGE